MNIKNIFCLLALTLMTHSLAAKDRDLVLQIGKVVDADQAERYVGAFSHTSSTGRTSHSTAYYVTEQTYTIDSGDVIYVVRERVKRSREATLTVNAPVKFAIEKTTMVFIADDGKRHEARIVKKILKTADTK